MATDFCGNEIQPGDLVIYLDYHRTSAELKMGAVQQCAEHSATIRHHAQKSSDAPVRRAEYKIVDLTAMFRRWEERMGGIIFDTAEEAAEEWDNGLSNED